MPPETTPEGRSGGRRTGTVAVLIAVVFGLVLTAVDWPAFFWIPGAGLDDSWFYAVNLAFLEHRQWGTEIVWTYGPYGMLAAPSYHSYATWALTVAVTAAVHVGFFAIVTLFLVTQARRLWQWLIVGCVFLLPLAGWPALEMEATLGAMLLLHLANAESGRLTIVTAAIAGILLAGLLTVKGTALTSAVGLLMMAGILAGRHRAHRFLLSAGTTAAGFVVLWLLARQSLPAIPAYIRSSYEIIAGYSSAMSVFNEASEVHFRSEQVILAALLLLATAGGAAIAALRRDRRVLSLTLLALPVLFVTFKESFTRFGDRGTFFFSMLVIVEAFILVQSLQPGVRLWETRIARPVAGGLVAAVLVSGGLFAIGGAQTPPAWPLAELDHHARDSARTLWALQNPGLEAGFTDETAARVRAAVGLSERLRGEIGNRTVDIIPWEIDLVQAYGLNWDPRPVLGSYQAYTPYLDGIDASHMKGPSAPDFVLLSAVSVDGRYWLYDEPALMRTLLENYRTLDWEAPYLLLERLNTPATGWQKLHTVHARLGQNVAVPDLPGDRVFAAVDVGYSLLGRILCLVFQPAELHIAIQHDGGDWSPGLRFIPAVGQDGVLVSSFAPELAAAADLFSSGDPHPISAFRISADRASDYISDYTVTFYAEPPS